MKRGFKQGISLLVAMMVAVPSGPGMVCAQSNTDKNVLISELCDPKVNYRQDRFVELYNGSSQEVELDGWKLEIVENTVVKRTFELKGFLESKGILVLGIEGYPEANQTLPGEWTGFNGKGGDGAKLYDPHGTLVDDASGALSASDSVFTRLPDVGEPTATYNAGEWSRKTCENSAHATPGAHVSNYPVDETHVGDVRSNVASGVIKAGTEVMLECGTEGAEIQYAITDEELQPIQFKAYTGPFKIEKSAYLWAKATKEGMEESAVSKFEYRVLGVASIESVRENVNERAMVEGVITAKLGQYDVYIQDDTAGIIASQYQSGPFVGNVGDLIRVEGTIASYYDNAQIQPDKPADVTVVKEGYGVPEPLVISPADLSNKVEGMLVKVGQITVTADDSKGTYTVTDTDSKTGKVKAEVGQLIVGKTYESVTGVVNDHFDEHKIMVRGPADIVEDSNQVLAPQFNIPGGTVEQGTGIVLSTATEGANIYYEQGTDLNLVPEPTVDSELYTGPVRVNQSPMCIKAIAVQTGMKDSDCVSAIFTIGAVLRIHDIQGDTHVSPKAGDAVEGVRGIVTGISKDKYLKGFFMQEPDATIDDNPHTSEGIFVATNYTGIKVGDFVSAKGTVEEKKNDSWEATLKETQLKADWIDVLSHNQPLPTPVIIGENGRPVPNLVIDNDQFAVFDPEQDGIDYYEALEGMLVQINDPAIVGCDERYGEVYVLADQGRASRFKRTANGGLLVSGDYANPELLTLDDVINPITNPTTKAFYDKTFMPKPGDSFEAPIIGIVTYGFGKYKIYNTDILPAIKNGGLKREITEIENVPQKLNIASYNIENFDPGDGVERAEAIAKSMVTNLKLPDIIALIEVQDNDGATNSTVVQADATYKMLTDVIKKESLAINGQAVVYHFTDIPPVEDAEGGEPGGNIRVGFIYRPDRVTLVNENPGGSEEAVALVDGHLSKNPGRIEPQNPNFAQTRKSLAAEFSFNGELVFVIANHFSSKGGDEPDFGENQPPVKNSEPKRHEQAKVIHNFVAGLLAEKPEANVVVLGDMNDYQFSETLHLLEGKGNENVLTNLMEEIPANQQYSYNYGGNAQVLDNVLVSDQLLSTTICDPVNINSEFVDAAGRCSDHDPILIQIGFREGGLQNQGIAWAKAQPIGSMVQVTGIVANEPETGEDNTLLLKEGAEEITVFVNRLDPAIHQGVRVTVTGVTLDFDGQFQIQAIEVSLTE